MSPDLVLVVVASLVFGGVWFGMSKVTTNVFAITTVSMLAALLVYTSRSIFGFGL